MPGSPEKRARRAATLADVGREAGVSAMAVSAVLNETQTSARISEETKKRIRLAALKLNYRPNIAARALVRRRMNTIGVSVVLHDGELNHYFMELFNGIIEGAAHLGQNTMVFPLKDWAHSVEQVGRFCDGRIDGMILVAPLIPAEAGALLPHHTPFVSLHANAALPDTINLESDEEHGAFEMVQRLTSLGHRKILHISGPRGLVGAERRISGYRRALESEGIPATEAQVLETMDFTEACGYAVMSAWLKKTPREALPTAIFCANDAIAVGCLEAMASVGLRVPHDISLCGFDDTLAARTTVPQLATVRQPLRLMGERAVEVLLEQVDAHRQKPATEMPQDPLVFQTELVVRDSIAAPRWSEENHTSSA